MRQSLLNEVITEGDSTEKSSSFGSFLHGKMKVKSLQESFDGTSLTRELRSFMEDSSAVFCQIVDLKKNMFKHWKKGEYNEPLAEKAWFRVVNEAAKSYADEVIKEQRLWEEMFPVEVRQGIVEDLAKEFYGELKAGQVDLEELFNE